MRDITHLTLVQRNCAVSPDAAMAVVELPHLRPSSPPRQDIAGADLTLMPRGGNSVLWHRKFTPNPRHRRFILGLFPVEKARAIAGRHLHRMHYAHRLGKFVRLDEIRYSSEAWAIPRAIPASRDARAFLRPLAGHNGRVTAGDVRSDQPCCIGVGYDRHEQIRIAGIGAMGESGLPDPASEGAVARQLRANRSAPIRPPHP